MADWQRTLRLVDVWQKFKSDDCEEPIEKLALAIAKRLEKLKPFGIEYIDDSRSEIVKMFRNFGKGEDDNREEFDLLMKCLYSWADIRLDDGWPGKKVCWVATS